MSSDIDRVGRELIAALNDHDGDRVVALYAADYEGIDVAQSTVQRGREGMRQSLARYWCAFPDLRFAEETTVIQGNRLAQTWTAHGTHRGPLLNIPPTGREVVARGAWFLTIEGGAVRHATYIWDLAGALRAIGLLPEL